MWVVFPPFLPSVREKKIMISEAINTGKNKLEGLFVAKQNNAN